MTPDAAAQARGAEARNDGLDLLRATGAALVFATHLYLGFGMTWLGPLAGGGQLGIFIFFPLSGYLLYRPFVRGRVDLGRYAIARLARIAPAYYLALAGAVLLGVGPTIIANPIPSLAFTANTFALDTIEQSGFGQSWTIGVEAAFYALLPIIAAGLALRRWLLLPLVVIGVWYGLYSGLDHWASEQLPAELWAFGFGMVVARYEGRIPFATKLWPLGVAVLVLGLLNAHTLRDGATVAAGASILIAWAVAARPRLPFARWPANLSYGVYLWHMAITITVFNLGLRGIQLFVVAVDLTIAVAWLSFVFVERPVLRWSAGVRRRVNERAGPVRERRAGPRPADV